MQKKSSRVKRTLLESNRYLSSAFFSFPLLPDSGTPLKIKRPVTEGMGHCCGFFYRKISRVSLSSHNAERSYGLVPQRHIPVTL
nr:hypothetical protein [uncultured bacterium]